MAVHRAEVPEVEGFKQVALLQHGPFDGVFHLLGNRLGVGPKLADPPQQFPDLVFDAVVRVGSGDVGEVILQRPDVGVNGHAVVVEHDQHVGVLGATVVEALEGQPCGHGAVPDDGHVLGVFRPVVAAAHGHAKGSADACAAVAHAEGVVFTFTPLRETRQALVLAVGVEFLPTAGEDFVAVRLVADVPHDLVFRRVEDVVQRHGQFHDPQACAEVPSFFRDHVHNELTNVIRDLLKFFRLELGPQVRGVLDLGEVWAGGVSVHGIQIIG